MLRAAGAKPGYIFNLGHGVQLGTPPETVKAVVQAVHELPLELSSPGADSVQIPSGDLIRKYDRPGPRYTSYPTAPEWTPDLRARPVPREHLAPRPTARAAPLSLYVHLPFCREMCRFCGCNVDRHPRPDPRRPLPRLAGEGGGAGGCTGCRRGARSPSSTGAAARPPSWTSGSWCAAATSSWRATSPFGPRRRDGHRDRPGHHHARSQIETLAGLGFNRISMGVQDFDAHGAAGGRPHPGREGDAPTWWSTRRAAAASAA